MSEQSLVATLEQHQKSHPHRHHNPTNSHSASSNHVADNMGEALRAEQSVSDVVGASLDGAAGASSFTTIRSRDGRDSVALSPGVRELLLEEEVQQVQVGLPDYNYLLTRRINSRQQTLSKQLRQAANDTLVPKIELGQHPVQIVIEIDARGNASYRHGNHSLRLGAVGEFQAVA